MTTVTQHNRSKSKLQSILYALEDTRQWIIQADTKGGFLLTVNGVVLGFMLQQMVPWFSAFHKTKYTWFPLLFVALVCGSYLVVQMYALWYTIHVIVPRTPASTPEQTHRTRHVFNYSLSQHFPTFQETPKLHQEYEALTLSELEDEFVARLHVDAIVCSAKYQSFAKAFRGLWWVLGLGLLAIASTQLWPT